jgi:hypothetical protein
MGAPGQIERRFGQMNRRLRVQAAETRLAFREMTAAMSPLMGMAAAGGLTFGFEKAIENSSHLAHELQNLRNAGRSATEVAQAMAAANRTIAALPTTTLIDNLKVLNETTGAFGNFHHAVENLTFNQRVGSMMQNMLGDKAGERGEMFNSLVRAMEIRGATQDKGRYQREVGELYKSFIFTGGKVNPEEFLQFSKMANPYTKGMSLRYLSRIAPSLIQEFGGDAAGTMENTWVGTILGKAKNKISTEAWTKLGLLDPSQIISNKVGPVGWKPGAVKGTNLALTDPLAWSEQVLIPALRKQGFRTDDQLSLAKALMPLFRDRNANRLANVLVGDRDRTRLHKDEGLINGVPDVNKAYAQTLRNDPLAAWGALKDSMANLSSVLFGSGKTESPVAIALVHVANGINMVAQAFERHPLLGNGAGIALGLGAATATLKVFGVGLKWLLSPLNLLLKPLGQLGGMLWRALGPTAFRIFLRFGTVIRTALLRLGPMLLELAPVVGEAIMGVFALVSNPLGWTVLAVLAGSAAIALVITFKKQIWAWMKRSWGSITATFTSLDWGSIGKAIAWGIADGLTFGLASRIPAAARWLMGAFHGSGSAAPTSRPAAGFRLDRQGSTPRLLAGHRAMGGPVLGGRMYLVGERGPELFQAPMSGSITTATRTAAMFREAARSRRIDPFGQRDRRGRGTSTGSVTIQGATIVIQDTRDPQATARAVEQALRRMAAGQDAAYAD